jgi:PAS domain S-box-containing protein
MKAPLRILYLEDNPNDVGLVQSTLVADGIECDVVRIENESEFLTALEPGGFDIIFAAYSLPSFHGLSALAIAQKKCPNLPFIFISGTVDEEMAIETLKSGATDYIFKNRLSKLVPAVRRALSEAEQRAEHRRTEEALRKSEEHFRTVVQTANDAIITIDSHENIVFWNQAAETMFDYSADEVLGKPVTIIIPGRFQESHNHGKQRIVQQEESKVTRKSIKTMELAGLKKDGNEFPVEITLSSWTTGEGTFLTAILHDLSQRTEDEMKYAANKGFLENIFDATQDGIMASDAEGNIMGVNKALQEMLGFTEMEIIGKHTAELTAPDEANRTVGNNMVTELIEKGFVKNFESTFIRKDGSLCPVEVNISYLKNKEGERKAAIGIIRDISERKRAEDEIKKAKDFLESVIENSRDGIVVSDEFGKIISVNTALTKMSSFSREELIEEHVSMLAHENEDMRRKIRKNMKDLIEKGFSSYEVVSKTKEGKSIDIECNMSMVKDGKGNHIAGISIIRDISERKRMEHQLVQSEKLKVLGELSGGVAHDFNNMLSTILGRIQLLRRTIENPNGKPERRKAVSDLKKGLEIIEKASLDGAETVRRIQEFSRKGKKKEDDTYFVEVDINTVINDALEFTKARWKDEAESKGIKINIKRKLLPVPCVLGSASELREVLTNFIHNAIDAMPHGGVISVGTLAENSTVSIKLEDSGIGIPKEIQEKIFDPFFTTKGPQATGLGMSVSYGIINRHQGTITVDSTVGKGTTFTINLPVPKKRGHKGKAIPVTKQVDRASILVIEDEEPIRDLLCDILVEGGHEVEAACSGSDGIELFKKKDFDLVFTDLGMPEMSGWQVAKEIKKINRNTPVALITGWEIQLKESEVRENGVNLVVTKPFQMDQVLRLVEKGMEIRERLKNN